MDINIFYLKNEILRENNFFCKKTIPVHIIYPFCEQLFESYFRHYFNINFVHEKSAQIWNLTL